MSRQRVSLEQAEKMLIAYIDVARVQFQDAVFSEYEEALSDQARDSLLNKIMRIMQATHLED